MRKRFDGWRRWCSISSATFCWKSVSWPGWRENRKNAVNGVTITRNPQETGSKAKIVFYKCPLCSYQFAILNIESKKKRETLEKARRRRRAFTFLNVAKLSGRLECWGNDPKKSE